MTKIPDLERTPASRETVTLVDVAKAAGVSPNTVSDVITGKGPISPQTRRRVLETVRALGYQRLSVTSLQARHRVGVIALAMPLHREWNAVTTAEFIAGATDTAHAHHFDILPLAQDRDGVGFHRVSYSVLADAAIIIDVEPDDARVPPLLASYLPAVLVGGDPARYPSQSHVGFDYVAAGAACLSHLADLGHLSVAHLRPPATGNSPTSFYTGFQDAAARRAVRASSHPTGLCEQEITSCVSRLLATEAPTGLVVDDETALPFILAAVESRGLRIPEDLSVIAVCSATAAKQQRTLLTAVVIPGRTLGTLAVERAVRLLEFRMTASVELLAPQVTIGGSTAAA